MGAGEAFIAGGVEAMSRVPMMGFNPMPNPRWDDSARAGYLNMGLTAENLADRFGISRDEQDAYAAASQRKAAAAQADGRLAAEIAPVGAVDRDGCIRGETSPEKLAGLKPAFKADGSVTAGNSSPLTDGASATLVCSEEFVRRHDLTPLARVAGYAVSGCAPEIMGIGPVEATRKALARAGISAGDLDVIEMNEAFAVQVLACCRELDIDPEPPQPGRRRDRPRPSARRHRRAARRQGGAAPEARRRPLRARHPVHRRRPGHRPRAGGGVMGEIRKAAVLGAGVMGSGIAAHLANAGIDVVLLDVERATAAAGVARQRKVGGFMDPAFAERIVTGSVDEDLPLLADADWIIEAVAERLDVKQPLYRRVDAVRAPGSIVSSNTSTFPLATLTEGLPESFARDFLITHFFNPPRTMRLLELIAGPRTRAGALETIRDFGDRRLGKSVVICRDTPGFIANRIGNYWMSAAVNEAIALGLDVEVADAALVEAVRHPGDRHLRPRSTSSGSTWSPWSGRACTPRCPRPTRCAAIPPSRS